MSCSSSKSNKDIIPKKTDYMKTHDKKYVWKNIDSNPNKYCWVPVSSKYISSKIPIEQIDNIPTASENPNADADISKIQKNAENIIRLYNKKSHTQGVDKVSYNDPKKFKIVRDFIKRKGLILYGGFAINSYLPSGSKIYNRSELPDYDFFSYDPWKDALELSQILYDSGYIYTEIRSGMHVGTFKVYSDFWNIADITYFPKKHFDQIKTFKKNGLTLVSPAQLNIDMYKQLLSPGFDITRWLKVYKRQKLMENWTKPLGKKTNCSDIFIHPVDPPAGHFIVDQKAGRWVDPTSKSHTLTDFEMTLMNTAYAFIKTKKLLLSGAIAYNILVEAAGGTNRLYIDHFKVLSEKAERDISELYKKTAKILNANKLPVDDLTISLRHKEWQAINNDEYILMYKANPICIIAQIDTCTPYIYLFNKYITPIDYIKYELYNDVVFDTDEKNVKIAKCKIRYITALQNNYYSKKNIEEFTKSPFQRLVLKCRGSTSNIVKNTLLQRWLDIVESKKNIKTINPKKNTITLHNTKNKNIKIYPSTRISTNCYNKNKNACSYPCLWNNNVNKCVDDIKGPYRINDTNHIPTLQADSVVNAYYPTYG